MRRSHIISVQIDLPYTRAYPYLAEPANFVHWANLVPESYRQLANGDWIGELTSGGKRHFRFTPHNDFGVLDHVMFVPGGEMLWMPMRATPNEQGTELSFTFYQRQGMTDDQFASTVEWIETDLLSLKSLLEAYSR